MGSIYEAVYGDEQLGGYVCGVTVNAYGELQDDYGKRYEELFQSTTISREQANRINWDEPYMVNFPKVWQLNHVNPTVEAETARQEAKDALDCLYDEGIFDFDILCP
jgi:hypothetical protein